MAILITMTRNKISPVCFPDNPDFEMLPELVQTGFLTSFYKKSILKQHAIEDESRWLNQQFIVS